MAKTRRTSPGRVLAPAGWLRRWRDELQHEAAAFWKAVAVGFFVEFLGSVPGPVILGELFKNFVVQFRIAQQVHVVFQVFDFYLPSQGVAQRALDEFIVALVISPAQMFDSDQDIFRAALLAQF